MKHKKINVRLIKKSTDFFSAAAEQITTGSPVSLLLLAVDEWVEKAIKSKKPKMKLIGRIVRYFILTLKILEAIIPLVS